MYWKKNEINYLVNNFSSLSDGVLSSYLKKSINAIRIKASRLNLRKNSSIYRENLTLNKNENEIIIGSLLGDLSCRRTKTSKNCRLEGGHCLKQEGYAKFKINLLKKLKWCVRKTETAYYFQTKSFKCLNYYHDLFYSKRKKIITREILENVGRLGLLIWYLDDGSFRKRDKSSCLHTNGFSHVENLIIKKWFEEKWNIYPNIWKNKDNKKYPGKIWYFLYFPVSETVKLLKLFHNFKIPKCMEYKVPLLKSNIYLNPISEALVAYNQGDIETKPERNGGGKDGRKQEIA